VIEKSYLYDNTNEILNYFLVINERESSPFLGNTQGKFVTFQMLISVESLHQGHMKITIHKRPPGQMLI
jgi:hypothetical protein